MKKNCFFCIHKKEPSFKDVENLLRFLTPRRKIMPKDQTNFCAKHQRLFAAEVKRARFLGLIPYTLLQTYKIREIESDE